MRKIVVFLAVSVFAAAGPPAAASDSAEEDWRRLVEKQLQERKTSAPPPPPATMWDRVAAKIRTVQGITDAEWRPRTETFIVVLDLPGRGTDELYELFGLRLCRDLRALGLSNFYIHVVDHRYLSVGRTETLKHMLCR